MYKWNSYLNQSGNDHHNWTYDKKEYPENEYATKYFFWIIGKGLP